MLDVLGYQIPESRIRPCDGVSLLPLIEGRMNKRPRPIGFESGDQVSLVDNRYKLYMNQKEKTCELYDLITDPGETANIASSHPGIAERMKQTLDSWRASCRESLQGKDY